MAGRFGSFETAAVAVLPDGHVTVTVGTKSQGQAHETVLAQVAAAIAEAHSNIDGVEYLERDTNIAAIRFSIEVKSRKHLADVIRRTRRLHVVHGVQRL